jgi:hypothetical protein
MDYYQMMLEAEQERRELEEDAQYWEYLTFSGDEEPIPDKTNEEANEFDEF